MLHTGYPLLRNLTSCEIYYLRSPVSYGLVFRIFEETIAFSEGVKYLPANLRGWVNSTSHLILDLKPKRTLNISKQTFCVLCMINHNCLILTDENDCITLWWRIYFVTLVI